MTKTVTPQTSRSLDPAVSKLEAVQSLRVGRELADTTWRMTVPVLIFAGLGLLADKSWVSKPWLTLLGTAVGFLVAAKLIKRQISRSSRKDIV